MIGYLMIFLSVFFNAAKGYSSKKVSAHLDTLRKNFAFNTVRLFLSFVFAVAIIIAGGVKLMMPTWQELAICFVAGASMASFACFWQLTIRSKAYMLASACSSASFVLPVLAGLLLFGETLTLPSAAAVVLIGIALVFLLRYDFSLNGQISLKELLCLALVLVSQGTMQCMQKAYVLYAADKNTAVYNLYMFFFAACTAAVATLFCGKDADEDRRAIAVVHRGNVVYLFVMSAALFAVSFAQTIAAKTVDAVILYPLLSGLSLAAGSIMSAVSFHEKPDRNSVIGIALVLLAVVLSKF